jgi:NADPH:quinone reductase-like Zn-dependent oxidoreductase
VRAVRIHEHGGPEVLHLESVAEPTAGPGELLARLRATSVNHRDVWIRRGHPHPAYRIDLPGILGIDVCADVVELGEGVEGFRPGDRVTANPYRHCGSCRFCIRGRFQDCPRFSVFTGTNAELFTLPAATAVAVDPGVPDEHVAAFPNTYVTAWQMLVGKARLSPADTLFVWAGTSGLGSAAIDIARLVGARVIASAGSEAKLQVLRGLGIADVVDHHRDDVVARVAELTGDEGASVVFEHIGQATWGPSLEIVAPSGTIVSAGATSGDDARMNITLMFAKQVRILGSRLGTIEDTIAAVRQLNAGRLRPLIGPTVSLADVAEGHRLLDDGEAVGKIIVVP